MISGVVVTFGAAAELPEDLDWLAHREREIHDELRPRRRADWALGRYVAARALAARLPGTALSRLEVLAASDGAPEPWLDGQALPLSLSLSHRAGWAACALGPPGEPVGVDLERVEPRSAAFVRDYFVDIDRAWLREGHPDALVANLLWSAKEAALKVVRSGLRRDTRSVVVVRLDPAGADGAWARLAVDDRQERVLRHGWWRPLADCVLTVLGGPDAEVGPPLEPVGAVSSRALNLAGASP